MIVGGHPLLPPSFRLRSVIRKRLVELTEKRDDDDDEVEDVPRFLEVVDAQTEHFDDALEREDCQERDVDDLQTLGVVVRLALVLDGHRDHVEHDEDHDEDVELLITRQVVEEQLNAKLQKRTKSKYFRSVY